MRKKLLWLLLSAIVLTAMVQALVAYRTALAQADAIFDYHIQQMALALRAGVPSRAYPLSGMALDDDDNPDMVVQVWSDNGNLVFQSTRAGLPDRAALGFSNRVSNGIQYRVFSTQAHNQFIQVAQDMTPRTAMARRLALQAVLPILVMAPLLMLLAGWIVRSAFAPVARVRRQLAQREADDLSEVSEVGLPEEIQPLVHELNLLFRRVGRAFEAQKSFVSDAAHELRSPLAALKLQAQSLQRAPDDASRQIAVERLSSGIDRATRMVEQLLALARQQAGVAHGGQMAPVDLSDIARQAVIDAASLARDNQIDLGLHGAAAGSVAGQRDALYILVRNLVDNAVKYTPQGGRVDVELSQHNACLVLSVDDSGPGIAPEDRQRVLDRFYRVPGSVAGGSGLGLAIVQSIAQLHQASVTLLQSERLKGLRVEVRFPLERTQSPTQGSVPRSE